MTLVSHQPRPSRRPIRVPPSLRRELGAALDADSSPEEVRSFLGEAFAAGLGAMSALVSSAPVMQQVEVDYVLSDLTSGPVLFATC